MALTVKQCQDLQESEGWPEDEFKAEEISVSFAVLFIAWFLVSIYIGGKHQEQRLYKHGFRLLEEQIAVYIKENYSGVSKVEFTDIYKYGSSGLYVYPIIMDNHGNRTLLNDSINGAYGTSRGFMHLNFTPPLKSEDDLFR